MFLISKGCLLLAQCFIRGKKDINKRLGGKNRGIGHLE